MCPNPAAPADCENADDDLVEAVCGSKQEAAMDGAAGDLVENAAFGREADFSCQQEGVSPDF